MEFQDRDFLMRKFEECKKTLKHYQTVLDLLNREIMHLGKVPEAIKYIEAFNFFTEWHNEILQDYKILKKQVKNTITV